MIDKARLDRSVGRFEAWWNGEIIDRPPITAADWTEHVEPEPPSGDLRTLWHDLDHHIAVAEARAEQVDYLGDAFPIYMPNLGPEVCATCYGAELQYEAATSYAVPNPDRPIPDLTEPNTTADEWLWIVRATQRSLEEGAGKWLTGVTDLHVNADILSSLIGAEEACFLAIDEPARFKRLCMDASVGFHKMFLDLWTEIAPEQRQATSWMHFLHEGPAYCVECDFLALISPKVAREAIFPSLIGELSCLERAVFHLDGPDALRHLDDLLSIAGVQAVQYVYGAGNGRAADWIHVYKRILDAGKSVVVECADLEDAYRVSKELPLEGLWFNVGSNVRRRDFDAFERNLR